VSATIGDDDAKFFGKLRRDVIPIGVTGDGGAVNENDGKAVAVFFVTDGGGVEGVISGD
jgi:hypothetical protein